MGGGRSIVGRLKLWDLRMMSRRILTHSILEIFKSLTGGECGGECGGHHISKFFSKTTAEAIYKFASHQAIHTHETPTQIA